MSLNSRELAGFNQSTLPVIQSLLQCLDTPKSLGVLLKFSSILQLAADGADGLVLLAEMQELKNDLTFDPNNYLAGEVNKASRDLCATSLLSKLPNIFGLDLKAAALESSLSAEDHCAFINQCFYTGSNEVAARDLDLRFDRIKHILRRILGRAPSVATLCKMGGWGPGGSYALNRQKASPEYKSEYERTITYELAHKIQTDAPGGLPSWFYQDSWTLVPGNLITTVPKNVLTDRTIAIEPGINSWIQKGIGSAIRRRLLKHGIDLNDQRFNAFMALEAEAHGFCTVDLKAASDSISLAFVERVLPSDWLELVMVARSQRGSFNSRQDDKKTWFDYEKVSSMGNGFTFELESCLFFAILQASGVEEKHCYVYGDDLLFPQMYYDRVKQVLEICGFKVNTEKSFHKGLFYESCGIYSFQNIDITPIKVKEVLNDAKDSIILVNKIRMYAHISAYGDGCDRRYLPAWRTCLGRIPKHVRDHCRGPIGGGITIYCNINELSSSPIKDPKGSWKKIGKNRFSLLSQWVGPTRPVQVKGTNNYQTFVYQHLVPKIRKLEREFMSLSQYRLFIAEKLSNVDIYSESSVSLGNVVKQLPTGQYVISTTTSKT